MIQRPPTPPSILARSAAADENQPRESPKTSRLPVRSSARLARGQDAVVRGRLIATPSSPGQSSRGDRQASHPKRVALTRASADSLFPATHQVSSPATPARLPAKDIAETGTVANGAEPYTARNALPAPVAVVTALTATAPPRAAVMSRGSSATVVAAVPRVSVAAGPTGAVAGPLAMAMPPDTVAGPGIVALPPAADVSSDAVAAPRTGAVAAGARAPATAAASPITSSVTPCGTTVLLLGSNATAEPVPVAGRNGATAAISSSVASPVTALRATNQAVAAAPVAPPDEAVAAVTVPVVPIAEASASEAAPVASFSATPAGPSAVNAALTVPDASASTTTATSPPNVFVAPTTASTAVFAPPALAVAAPSAASALASTGPALPRSMAVVLPGTAVAPADVPAVAVGAFTAPSGAPPASPSLTTPPMSISAGPSTTATIPSTQSAAGRFITSGGGVATSVADVGARRAAPVADPVVTDATFAVTALATAQEAGFGITPVAGARRVADFSMTLSPTSTSAASRVAPARTGSLSAAAPVRNASNEVPPPTPVARPGDGKVIAGSAVPEGGGATASVGDDNPLLIGDDPEDILPVADVSTGTDAPERVDEGGGIQTPAPPDRQVGTGTADGSADTEMQEANTSTLRAAQGPVGKPIDGVYTLNESTRAQIATLLRTLFVVQKSSDKSIMPFLGIVHYLMGFSALVGVASLDDRSDFFNALLVAFERPVSMKFFMEEAFQCGPQGLHVGGRTRPLRHVTGQPHGLQEDVLRARINADNVKAQWISRRLSLRQRVNVHPSARAGPGGLSQADRDTIAASLAGDGVCSKLRERGCIVKYAKVGAMDRKPLSLTFQWDASSTWFPNSLEADLVCNLKDVLLKATPVLHKDGDPQKPKEPRPASRNDVNKRLGTGGLGVGSGRSGKRVKVEQPASSTGQLAKPPGDCCPTCGQAVKADGLLLPDVVPAALEHWSADVCRSESLPRGGHVLAVALPMDMDAGPGGRQTVKGVLSKTSKTGASPYRYSLSVSCGDRVPDAEATVQGGLFTPTDGRDGTTGSMSHDILRSVTAHMARRTTLTGASRDRGDTVTLARPAGDVRLSVRAAAKPTLQTHRFDFTSEFELLPKGELVQRTPGRVIIFWPGMDPVPVGGAFTL